MVELKIQVYDFYILNRLGHAGICFKVSGVCLQNGCFKGIYLSKALTCMKFSCINKNCFFIKETDTFGHIVV